jgi:hypothetical protein
LSKKPVCGRNRQDSSNCRAESQTERRESFNCEPNCEKQDIQRFLVEILGRIYAMQQVGELVDVSGFVKPEPRRYVVDPEETKQCCQQG